MHFHYVKWKNLELEAVCKVGVGVSVLGNPNP